MEYASLLAGEKWSDHPRCTHPLLSSLARGVNDHTSDTGRFRLVGLIPRVVGLAGDDPLLDLGIAVRCGVTALPVVAEYRQRALGAGLLAAQNVIADLDDRESSAVDTTEIFRDAHDAAARVPHLTHWAEELASGSRLTMRLFQRRSAPAMVRVAVVGIAEACIPDPDALLYQLLEQTIEDCTRWMEPESSHHQAREVAAQ